MATTTADNKNSFGLPAIIFAAWAAVLLTAFLSYRGSDIGQLLSLVGNLGGGPLFGSGIVDSIAGSVVALLIVASWFGVGNFVVSLFKVSKAENHSHVLELTIATAIGAAVWSLAWFFLGAAGAYGRTAAIAAIVVGIVFAALGFRRIREAKSESRVPESPSRFDRVLIGLIAVPVILAFIASLAPPTAKDALLYHFALPKAFIAQGNNAFVEGNIASYLALGTEMHYVWAMLLGGSISQRSGEAAAGMTAFAFFPLLLAAIFGWARELKIERRWSLIAVLIVAAVPTAYHVAASGYVDVVLALFVTLAIYALCRWWRTLESGWLILIAIFLGAALFTKLTTIVVIAAFALVILLRVRKAQETEPDDIFKIAASGFAALILAGVIASPWYMRTWQQTGSPVFPFYMSILPGAAPNWDAERSNLFQAMNSQYGGLKKTPLDYLLAPWNLSIRAQPEYAENFDGVLGVAFLFGLPLLVWVLWKFDMLIEVKIGVGVAAVMFLFWLFSSQQLRYLLPILPVLAIAIVLSTQRVAGVRSVLTASFTAAAIAGIAVSTAWFLQKAPLRVALGGQTREQYLTRNLDYYPYYQIINAETPADAKVWLINMRRDTYNLNRPYFSDYLFEDWTFRKLLWESKDAEDLRSKTEAMNVGYVLARHDFLFDYDTTTLVDDRKSRAENETKLRIAKEFLLRQGCGIERFDSKFSLIWVEAHGCGSGSGLGRKP